MSNTGGNSYHGITASDNARIIAGNIINLPPRSKPAPSCMVSQYFGRDPSFVGREEILGQLENKLVLGDYHNRAVLSGLGGIGKTQIAIEFAYRYAEAHPDHWVFWVYAGTRERLLQSYRKIAVVARVETADVPSAAVLDDVRDWLSDEQNGSWLIIVDNADDSNVLFGEGGEGGEQEPLASYIPQPSHGAVLITSRSNAGSELMEKPDTIVVEGMSASTAIGLLDSKMRQKVDDKQAAERLVELLDGILLAITQADAYMNKCRWPIHKYVTAFQTDEEQADLLHKEWGDMRRDRKVSNAVLTTWRMSFDQLARTSPEAVSMLARMSLLDRQCIPESLIIIDDDPMHIQSEAKGLLMGYAFLTEAGGDSNFTIHRLVQVCMKAALRERGLLRGCEQQVILLLGAKLPSRGGQLLTCIDGVKVRRLANEVVHELCPHMLVAESYMHDEIVTHAQLALLDGLEDLAHLRVDTLAAVDMGARVVRQSALKLGPRHIDTVRRSICLAIHLRCHGRLMEALTTAQEAADAMLQLTGHSVNTMGARLIVADIFVELGRLTEGRAVLRDMLSHMPAAHESADLSTLEIIAKTCSLLVKLGENEKAKDILLPIKIAAEMRNADGRLGAMYLIIPTCLTSCLADIAWTERKYEAADVLYCQVLQQYMEQAPGSREVPMTRIKLGKVNANRGQHRQALSYFTLAFCEAVTQRRLGQVLAPNPLEAEALEAMRALFEMHRLGEGDLDSSESWEDIELATRDIALA